MALNTRSDFGELLKERGRLGNAAEVGVAAGQYALEILQWGVSRLYMVDLWGHVPDGAGMLRCAQEEHDANYRAAMDRIEPHKDRAVVLRGLSDQMAVRVPIGSLDFLHVDGAHDYLSVKRDLVAWYPRMKRGGIVSGHDYLNPAYGVHEAANEFAKERGLVIQALDVARDNGAHACFWMEVPSE